MSGHHPECPRGKFRDWSTCECLSLTRAEVARLTDLLASQRAEYETALALATETVRDLTAEADAARQGSEMWHAACVAVGNERDKWIDGWKRVAGERDAEKAALAAEKAQTLKYQTALAREEAAHAATREELAGTRANDEANAACANQERQRAERAEAQLATMREALQVLTMWLSRWRHAVSIRAEGATQAWDELERAHNAGCAALSASAPTEPRADLPLFARADLMRVAEAVREACSNIAYDDNVCGTMNRIDALDLAAIVREVTKS